MTFTEAVVNTGRAGRLAPLQVESRKAPIARSVTFSRLKARRKRMHSLGCAMISGMPSGTGQVRRSRGTGGNAQFQTRMPKWLKDRYHAAAKQRGVTLSMYLEQLIELDHLLPSGEAAQPPADQLSA